MTSNLHASMHDLATEAQVRDLVPEVHRVSQRLRKRRTVAMAATVMAGLTLVVPLAATFVDRLDTNDRVGPVDTPTPTAPTPTQTSSPDLPAISAAHGFVYYAGGTDGRLVMFDDGEWADLATLGRGAVAAAVSPDGTQVAWLTQPDGASGAVLWAADINGVNRRILHEHPYYPIAAPMWSPDSRHVLIAVTPDDPASGDVETALIDTETTEAIILNHVVGYCPTYTAGGFYLVVPTQDGLSIHGIDGGYPLREVSVDPSVSADSIVWVQSASAGASQAFVQLSWGDGCPPGQSNALLDLRTGKKLRLPVEGDLLDGYFLPFGGMALRVATGNGNELAWVAADGSVSRTVDEPAQASGWDLLTYLPPAVDLPAPTDTNVFGPDGYGGLKLGMTLEQALASGEISPDADEEISAPAEFASGCVHFVLRAHPDAGGFVTLTDGVAILFADEDMRTPEGIGIGSTVEEFKAAYPDYHEGENGLGAPAPGTDNHYSIHGSGRIEGLVLTRPPAPCIG